METYLFIRGIAMGFALSIPVGPIFLLCIHRALANGWLTAFLSTLGAVVADCALGTIAALGSSYIAPWVEHQQTYLRIGGGLFIMLVAVRSYYATLSMEPEARKAGLLREFLSSFVITIFNPVNYFGVLGVFAAVGTFHANELQSLESLAELVVGVFAGASIWWMVLSIVADAARRRFAGRALIWVNHGSAALLAIFGLGIMASALLGHADWLK
ncbi:MAG TPA: LysE family transporter [Magnetospirillaceae bacterium]|jgi:threonine/homoserine/homoserine lactone efflux protein